MRKTFKTELRPMKNGGVLLGVPFDPDEEWGKKRRHLVGGTVGSCSVRGTVEAVDGGFGLKLGPAWLRGTPFAVGEKVSVAIQPEGPQRDALDADIAAALAKEPKAAEFFDGLAQFYRKGYLTWIQATKRSPEERVRRIRETVRLLKAGVKQRPN